MGNKILVSQSEPLYGKIQYLLSLGHEGGYWDYKSDYPATSAEKLHDIICMANNLENRDAYLIYGADDDGNAIGIENTITKSRLDTKALVEFLRTKPFAGGHIPKIDVRTMKIKGHELDIVTIYNSSFTPYYLTEDYGKDTDHKKRLRAGSIYVRTENINTPMFEIASFGHTEYLWRKRFGIDTPPFERFKQLLHEPHRWADVRWGTDKRTYHTVFPEFQIIQGEVTEDFEQLRMFYDNECMFSAPLSLNYFSTTLYETFLFHLDEGRCIIPRPSRRILFSKYLYYYFLLDSIDGDVLYQITNGTCSCKNRSGLDMPILIFENAKQQSAFENFANNQQLIDSMALRINNSSIYQQAISRELAEGKHQIGDNMSIAIFFELFKVWKKSGDKNA